MKSKICVLTAALLTIMISASSVSVSAAGWENGLAAASSSTASTAQFTFSVSAYQNAILSAVNQERRAYALSPLTATEALNRIAAMRAQEASVLFSHTRPDGSTPASLFRQYGVVYSHAGENLAAGYTSVDALVSAWMASPEHRSNILNGSYQNTGISVYKTANGTIYFAQMFCGK